MTREQFIQHVESTQKAFRRFLVALCCGDSALADDVAQESYTKAYLSCDSFSNPDKFNAWIYRIDYKHLSITNALSALMLIMKKREAFPLQIQAMPHFAIKTSTEH